MLLDIETRKQLKPIETTDDTLGVKYHFYCGFRKQIGSWPFIRRMYDVDTRDAPTSAIEAFLNYVGALNTTAWADAKVVGDY